MLKKAQLLEIKRLRVESLSKRALALRLDIDRRTVASALLKDVLSTRLTSIRIATTIEPYREFVLKRLAEYSELGALPIHRKLIVVWSVPTEMAGFMRSSLDFMAIC